MPELIIPDIKQYYTKIQDNLMYMTRDHKISTDEFFVISMLIQHTKMLAYSSKTDIKTSYITTKQLSKIVGIKERKLYYILDNLEYQGVIKRTNSKCQVNNTWKNTRKIEILMTEYKRNN